MLNAMPSRVLEQPLPVGSSTVAPTSHQHTAAIIKKVEGACGRSPFGRQQTLALQALQAAPVSRSSHCWPASEHKHRSDWLPLLHMLC